MSKTARTRDHLGTFQGHLAFYFFLLETRGGAGAKEQRTTASTATRRAYDPWSEAALWTEEGQSGDGVQGDTANEGFGLSREEIERDMDGTKR